MNDFKSHLEFEQAQRQFQAGQLGSARTTCEKVLRTNKRHYRATHLLGMIAFAATDFSASSRYILQCLAVCPNDPMLHYQMGCIRAAEGRYPESIARFEKAAALKPGYVQAIVGKADVQERAGDRDGARATLQPLLDAGVEDEGMASVLVKVLANEKKYDEAVALAVKSLGKPPGDPHSRNLLWMQIGRVYDRMGRAKEAFDAFSASRKMVARPFDAESYIAATDKVINTFTRENLASIPRATNQSEVPVFIACMPRSGSTLVEQIIHAHPQAFGAGELNDITEIVDDLPQRIESSQPYPGCVADLTAKKADRVAQEYLTTLKKLAPKAQRVTNKNIHLYPHLGMIQILFPKSRIVHIRRHRIDNGFACFMAGLSPHQFPWATDLQLIGLAWREYERFMAHWREVLDLPMLEVKYEELVEHTEREIRRIIDFCGLPWDDQCLRYWEVDRKVLTLSYDQVRQPIFKTAVMRYKRYEQFLGPLIEAMGEEVM